MGAIWRAEHLALQAPVAVKLIDPDAVNDEQAMARFLREAKAAATLRSPHVVHIMDYGMDDGLPFIVMELLEGETLAQRLRRRGRLTPAETARIATHVGRAMSRAHDAGIVHRDLKPENVFLVSNEDEEIAKVLDFGVAKVEHGVLVDGERTRTGSILGTPYYMSPEQAQGNKTVDHRSDLWALGVMVFECLIGRRPFFSDGLGDLVLQICVRDMPIPSEAGSVPPTFDAWFARAVCRDVEQRFQSARDLTDALREVLGVEARGITPETGPSSSAESARSSSRETTRDAPLSTTSRGSFDAATLDGRTPPPSRPDPIAATLAAPSEVPATSPERLAEASPTEPHSSHLGLLVGVAAVALGLGIGGGVLVIRGLEQHPAPPEPTAALPELASSEPLTRKPSTRRPNDRRDAVADAPPSTPSGSAEPRAAGSATPAPSAKLDAGAPDAGWVKPAWAIPDDVIPRRVDGPLDAPVRTDPK